MNICHSVNIIKLMSALKVCSSLLKYKTTRSRAGLLLYRTNQNWTWLVLLINIFKSCYLRIINELALLSLLLLWYQVNLVVITTNPLFLELFVIHLSYQKRNLLSNEHLIMNSWSYDNVTIATLCSNQPYLHKQWQVPSFLYPEFCLSGYIAVA